MLLHLHLAMMLQLGRTLITDLHHKPIFARLVVMQTVRDYSIALCAL